jgi:hypothetical protein
MKIDETDYKNIVVLYNTHKYCIFVEAFTMINIKIGILILNL